MAERLAVFYDDLVLNHDTGEGFFEAKASPHLPILESHPENGNRLRNMLGVLKEGPIAGSIDWYQSEPANRDDLRRFHTSEYIDGLAAIPVDESRAFTSTTVFGPGSFDICCMAAGLCIGAARHVYEGSCKQAYALIRPPGHHAQPAMADGYCFVNNIGVAIEYLREQGMQKAAIIDWDVHHGNGTEEGFYYDSDILTVSLHMDHGAWGDSHLQTGNLDEVGSGIGYGKNLNIPMPYGSGDIAYRTVFDEIIAPVVRAHEPEIIVIANGQDANQFDPNGRQLLSMNGFYQLGQRARQLAAECSQDKLLLVQEGGYAISYAAYCLHAALEGVLGHEPGLSDPLAYMAENTDELANLLEKLKRHPSVSEI